MSTDTVTITGHGDDAITLTGVISAEIDTYEDDVTLAFSDGTILTFGYTADGVWKAIIVERGTADLTIIEAQDNSRDDLAWPDYTDQVTIGPVTSVERRDDPDTDGDEPPISRWEV